METKLARLQDELDAALDRKETFAHQAQVVEQKLDRAGKLIGGLGGEQAR